MLLIQTFTAFLEGLEAGDEQSSGPVVEIWHTTAMLGRQWNGLTYSVLSAQMINLNYVPLSSCVH